MSTLHTVFENPTLYEIHRSKISLHRAKADYSYPTIRLPYMFSKLAGLRTHIYQTVHDGALAFNWLFTTLVLVVLALNYLYIRMRDNIGYLLVILPFAFVPVAIWSAISPRYGLNSTPVANSYFWGSLGDVGTNHARSA